MNIQIEINKKEVKGEKRTCLIERAIQDEIDRGVPPERRTKAWYISCPCPKCSPHYL